MKNGIAKMKNQMKDLVAECNSKYLWYRIPFSDNQSVDMFCLVEDVCCLDTDDISACVKSVYLVLHISHFNLVSIGHTPIQCLKQWICFG